ncbi:ABC transporter permease [Pandoraea apista]|uniref:ABC transporter permease n=1 Tax=Pandoraea apista TaxID=93218 RepID=UPI0009E5EF2B|nr:ABC transporter permease subunit [Pandoraea apista]RRW99427.1 ABC transporter permease subunit [Pandoraea apista]RRX07743.1 ABC transporter permease subunit [Pandoraea apista]
MSDFHADRLAPTVPHRHSAAPAEASVTQHPPRRARTGALVWAVRIVAALFLVYLCLPVLLLLIGAFGQTWTNTVLPVGITSRWFAELAGDPSFRRAFSTSLIVALSCCTITAAVGLPLAYTLHHRARYGRGAVARWVTLMPVAVPALTLGFGYIAVFSGDTLPWLGSLPLLVLAHTVLTLPYLTQTLLADLRHLDIVRLEDCAATLGASPWRQFATVAVPNLTHSLVAGLVMVAALSIGEFQISNLIAGFRYRNYPVVLLQAFYGATGFACAATVVLLVLALAATGLSIVAASRQKVTS